VRFPGSPQIISETRLQAWVEEDQKRAICGCFSNQVTVAAFYYPSGMNINEALKRSCDGLTGARAPG